MQSQLFVDMVLKAWNNNVKKGNEILGAMGTEEFKMEVSPGKNTVGYLVGHLIAVHDYLFTLLSLGERSFAHYDAIFLHVPDKSGQEFPSSEQLLTDWNLCNAALSDAFKKLSPQQWFSRHNNISEEDFAKEPERNRLSVLITRIYHLSYHLGQIALVKK